MRAKFVYESVNFERGKNPKTSMGVGDRVAQYEEMMQPWLEKVEEKAKKFGFIDNTAEVKEIWKNHYTDRFSEEDEERDYLIRSWRRKAGRIIGKKRYPTVKLELRELSSYWEEVSHHVRDANEYGVYYIVLSDPNHQVEFPGQAWYGFDTDDDLQKWTTDKHWEELITKSGIYESVNFERGADPRRSMKVGQSADYPDIDLFEEIHEFWTNVDTWPEDFESVTPIVWSWPYPSFEVKLKSYSGEDNNYKFFLTKNGLEMIYNRFVDAGGGRRSSKRDSYRVGTYGGFMRILESNHVQHLNIEESVNFERGQDPKTSMGIGKAGNPFVIDFMEEEYDADGRVDGPLPEDHSQDTWFESCDNQETIYVLNNWKTAVDGGYYFYGHFKDESEDDSETIHAPELNDEYVEFEGELYYIPDHSEYWSKMYSYYF